MNSEVRSPKSEVALFAFVGLGSNLGDSERTLFQAMDRLQPLSDQPLRRSSLWQTTPVDCPPGSPPFVNAVVGLAPRPSESPERLLDELQALEAAFGRQPKKGLHEPRPLDLDLIAFGPRLVQSARLTLPHPRAHLRRFVLAPLAEIAPDLVLPRQTRSVCQLLDGLVSDEVVRRLA